MLQPWSAAVGPGEAAPLAIVPAYGYGIAVKRQELEAALRALGWYFLKHGGSDDLWAHSTKKRKLVVPRHKEIKEHLARSILRQATSDE
jgi:predicted RNA binding protein YcfA (HicA-like mRNA interferase family)